MDTYFVKSFEEDYSTKTLVDKKKVTFQTLDDIVTNKIIKPNTKSFGQKKRLSTTILHKNYTKTYRPQGIIFQTLDKPNYVIPFDLVLLSDAKKMVVHYYRIKDNLHLYYNHKLINGFEDFVYKNIDQMIKRFSSPQKAWKALNDFRKLNGHGQLPESKFRLAEYNEAVFERQIKIDLVALFGYRSSARTLAKKYNLPHFVTAKDFFLHKQKT